MGRGVGAGVGGLVGDVVGNTLKCIQGPATERHLIEQLMDDVKRGQPHQTVLTNYTKTGQAFKNEVQIEPVGEADGLAAGAPAPSPRPRPRP